jgi:hydrophobic/amphiphilic exporter-1 (mainly G- bacteria), HAE1 family
MIEVFIKRKITTLMCFLGICLVGGIALTKLPLQLMPDIEFPRLTIVTSYENASPTEIEKLVTRHIEEAVTSVNGVLSLTSESIEGLSLVTARFQWGTNMDIALIETKEKVDIIKGQLPQDTGKSIVVKFDPKADPVMIYTVVTQTGNFKQLRKRVEKEIVPYLERIEGVAVVDVSGGYKRQINISLDAGKIYAHNLSLAEIMQSINFANYSFPAGYVEKGDKEYLIRTIGEFKQVSDLKNVVVGRNKNNTPVYLHTIADIHDGYKDRKSIIRVNGKESIALLIKKEPGKNTIAVSNAVQQEINSLQKKYGKQFVIQKIYDQSAFIRNAISNVFQAALFGGIIAIFVLFFFLKEARSPLIIATTIPVSIMGTFALMYFKGISINTMSLGGLALGVGMMVDAGIVVLESIVEKNRQKNKKTSTGLTEKTAAGTREVIQSVVASTLTTIVVFLPITFISGLSGAVFGELALTISFALLCSLLCSFSLIPMLYTFHLPFAQGKPRLAEAGLSKKLFRLSDRFMNRMTGLYDRSIRYALSHIQSIVITGIAATLIGLLLFMFIDFELMPKVDPGKFSIDIELPRGTTLAESAAFTSKLEAILNGKPYVHYLYAQIGSDPEENITEKTSGRGSHNITLQVILKKGNRPASSTIIAALKQELRFSENIHLDYYLQENVIASIFGGKSKPVMIELYGENNDILMQYGKKIEIALSQINTVGNIKSLLGEGNPELKIDIDRNKMASFGINIENIASTLKSAIHGDVATTFRTRDEEIDVRVRLKKEDRTEKSSIYKILVKSGSDSNIPLAAFINIKEGTSPGKVVRSEQSRVNTITASITSDRGKTLKKIDAMLARLPLPPGYEAKTVGEKDEIKKSLEEMQFALILALILIYMLLASQFQSFVNPLIVMLSIPVTGFGISCALLLTASTLNINSGIGIILLAGIVVNNAIVLFDYIEKERRATHDLKKAVINACHQRLKPILMTTATTVLAMVPLALGIGEGAEIQQSMAITVIGGLLFSTLLTLIFIPTVYYTINRGKPSS